MIRAAKLGGQIQDINIIFLQCNTLIGDNAWVEMQWMVTPIPRNCVSNLDDFYIFCHLQLQITIE